MRRVRSDWLQSFPRSSASFGPAAFNMRFTGFRSTCFSSRFCGIMRVGVGLVSRCQAGHTAMSLPTLKYIVLKLEVTNFECNVETRCWAVKHYLKNDELA